MNNDILNDDNWWTRTRFVVKMDTYKGQSYYEEIIEDWLENYCFSKYIKKEQGRKSRYYLGLTIYNFWFNYYFENDELIIEAWQVNQRLANFTATPYINLLHTLLDFEEYNDENNRNIDPYLTKWGINIQLFLKSLLHKDFLHVLNMRICSKIGHFGGKIRSK